ncbi:type VI secretion system baseplate subunit TssG [Aliikangiella marina]|uniref:Type VI secretion system baseplate subunit TssG n=1 Tax=Aliikangiella marina TaxID=1712262 RepID=A0A545TGP7_9GAMM|nr:type VI secretion system baseplate subunit TssG [Aliikangiella marina]TQV76409.1 type VI secretion system baseplate subunit TssG [Aliikangiella marina]
MSTTRRRKNTAVSQDLASSPHKYSFSQAVRLLERVTKFNQTEGKTPTERSTKGFPVARFFQPCTEAVRFRTSQTLRFSSAEINKITKQLNKNDEHGIDQWQVVINFMGLTGTQGVLPYHYTELILQRLKMKDESLKNFLDLFNHRIISLFYQASSKYHLPIEYERKKLNPPQFAKRDTSTQVLLSLIGLGTETLNNRLYTRDESLLFYSGLLTHQIRTASGLQQIIKRHFNIPVKIEEFVGQWQDLIDDVRSRLPSSSNPKGQNNALGKSTMLGKKGWHAQGKFRIILGPLNKQQAQTFRPGTKALLALDEIVKLYVRMEYDYDFIIRITRRETLDKAQLDPKQPPVIGWNTWLVSKSKQEYAEKETLDIAVSSRQFI